MSEVEVSIQSEKKTQDESSLALTNNVKSDCGENKPNKEENKALTPTKKSENSEKISSPEVAAAHTNDAALDSNKNEKPTPAKRTPSKRRSFVERAQKESEELVKNLGGTLDIEGGRKTRSSTRGTPSRSNAASTPPPAKKGRASNTTPAGTPRRGRGRKLDTTGGGDTTDSIAENEIGSPEGKNSSSEESKNDEASDKSKNDVKLVVDKDQTEENKNDDVEMNDVTHSSKTEKKSETSPSKTVIDEKKSPIDEKKAAVNSTKVETNESKMSPKKTVNDDEIKTPPVKSVDEEKVEKIESVESTIEPMEVDGKVADVKNQQDDGKVERESTTTINSNSHGDVDMESTSTTKILAAAATDVSKKINENDETSTAAIVPIGASNNKTINSIPTQNKNETSIDTAAVVTVTDEDKNINSVKDVPSVTVSSIEVSSPQKIAVTPDAVKDQNVTVSPTSIASANAIAEKSEKTDLCEPKLLSPQPPQISATSETLATPQYCN